VTGVADRPPHPVRSIEGATVEPDLDHPAPDLPAPTSTQPSPLVGLRTAFNTAALLSTTAVLVAIDPKIPPFRTD
jgi:hypothetical protein